MVYAVGQEKPSSSISSTPCPPDRVVKCVRVWLALAGHLVVLNNQAAIMLAGTPEPLFQPQALIAGFHNMATSGILIPHSLSSGFRGIPSNAPTIPRTVVDAEELR